MNRKSYYIFSLFVSSILIILNLILHLEGHPNQNIELAGGANYDNYMLKVDSPVTYGYAKDTNQKRNVDVLKGNYFSSDDINFIGGAEIGENIMDSVFAVQEVSDGYLFLQNRKGVLDTFSQTKIIKTDLDFNVLNEIIPFNDQYYGLSFLTNQNPNATMFWLLTDLGEKIAVDKDGNILTGRVSLGFPTISPISGAGSPGSFSFYDTPWISFSINDINHGAITAYQSDSNYNYNGVYKELSIPIDTGATWLGVEIRPFTNGNHLVRISTSTPQSAFLLYDNDLNYIKTISIDSGNKTYKILEQNDGGNYLVRIYSETTKDSNLMEIDENGIIEKSVSFTGSSTTIDFATKLSNASNNEKYFISGYTNVSGAFSGFAEAGANGAYIASLDENLNLINVNILDSMVVHNFQGIQDVGNDKILVYGYTLSGGDLFDLPIGGLRGSREGFIGVFTQQIDTAPKLPSMSHANIYLNSNFTATQTNEAMLKPIKQVMYDNTTNIETNSLDDYTTNTALLERLNKNVLNPNYADTFINWKEFGLTPIMGKDAYEVGPYKNVTYSVTDFSMLQTTTSTLINILDENTQTDNEIDLDNASYAIHATDIRIHINDLASLNYKNASKLKAWDLLSGEINNPLVAVDSNSVEYKVGVYNVTYTYNGISKINKVIVYDDNTIFGPYNNDPQNELNHEMIYAQSGVYRPSIAKISTLDKLTEYMAWDLKTGNRIVEKTILYKNSQGENLDYNSLIVNHYYITYELMSGTNRTVLIDIITGESPILEIKEKYVNTPLNTSFLDIRENIFATDVEDGVLTGEIKSEGTVLNTIKNISTINYSVTDADGNNDNGFRKYLVGYRNSPQIINSETIVADDFTLTIAEAKELTNDSAIKKSAVKAWVEQSGENLEIATVNIQNVLPIKGVYEVTFATANGSEITVQALVGNYGATYIIDANNIELAIDEWQNEMQNGTLDSFVKNRSKAQAKKYDIDGSQNISVTVDVSNLQQFDEKSIIYKETDIEEVRGASKHYDFTDELDIIENNWEMQETEFIITDNSESNSIPKNYQLQNIILGSGIVIIFLLSLFLILTRNKIFN